RMLPREADATLGAGPQKVGIPLVDIMPGMYTAIAVLAALARRAETGKGEFIDIGMLDVGVGFLANQAMNFLISGKPPRRNGNAHPNISSRRTCSRRATEKPLRSRTAISDDAERLSRS